MMDAAHEYVKHRLAIRNLQVESFRFESIRKNVVGYEVDGHATDQTGKTHSFVVQFSEDGDRLDDHSGVD